MKHLVNGKYLSNCLCRKQSSDFWEFYQIYIAVIVSNMLTSGWWDLIELIVLWCFIGGMYFAYRQCHRQPALKSHFRVTGALWGTDRPSPVRPSSNWSEGVWASVAKRLVGSLLPTAWLCAPRNGRTVKKKTENANEGNCCCISFTLTSPKAASARESRWMRCSAGSAVAQSQYWSHHCVLLLYLYVLSFLLFIQIEKSSANINRSNFLNPDGTFAWLRTAGMRPFYNVIDYCIFNCKYLLLHEDEKCQEKQWRLYLFPS